MKAQENNKIIAEFMGYRITDDQFKDENGFWNDTGVFETSWDWLMPVIIKMADAREDTHYKLYKTIDEAYEEVVEFINEYNKNK